MYKNYESVITQLESIGLHVEIPFTFGKIMRCKTDADRERRGWYALHEARNNDGESIIIGSYGIWQGAENNAQNIEIDKTEFSAEQKAAFKARLKDDKKKSEQAQQQRAEQAARKAESLWRNHFTETGHCDYLTRKSVPALGVRFSKKNSMAIPIQDIKGRIHGLQIILDREHNQPRIKKLGRDKEYWPPGLAKKGNFHQHGVITDIVLVAEGYATAATIHAATGLPVVIAFDANNIEPVIDNLRKKYKTTKILICADQDNLQKCNACKQPVNVDQHPATCPHCKAPHKRKNAGIAAAMLATLKHGCAWVAPIFSDENARLAAFSKN